MPQGQRNVVIPAHHVESVGWGAQLVALGHARAFTVLAGIGGDSGSRGAVLLSVITGKYFRKAGTPKAMHLWSLEITPVSAARLPRNLPGVCWQVQSSVRWSSYCLERWLTWY